MVHKNVFYRNTKAVAIEIIELRRNSKRDFKRHRHNRTPGLLFTDADRGERLLESGAVPSQDGAGGGSDGERFSAAPHEEPESQPQLGPAPSSLLPFSQSFSPAKSKR